MRDDFDEVVADRFKLLDEVQVPDTWSKVQLKVLDDPPASSADVLEQELSFASLDAAGPTSGGRPRRGWMLASAAAVVLGIVGVGLVFAERGSRQSTVVTTAMPDVTTAVVESSFSAAVESSGALITPSADEIALAGDSGVYRTDSGSTQISTAGNFAALRTCRTGSTCSAGWAYMTGSVDGGRVHRGVLGEAEQAEVFVLDDRFFVVMETSPGSQRTPKAWLIDSISGGRAELTWSEEPTIVNSPAQALVISEGHLSVARNAHQAVFDDLFLPRVVDARNGTIRPLAIPDNASANLPVTQVGDGRRIWIGTALDGLDLGVEERDAVQMAGLAYSDDGGTTWTEVTIPAELFASERLATKNSSGASIAADGDRIAFTSAWSYNDARYVYVSSDAGQSWSTMTIANPLTNNGAHLYVLADKRLLLVKSDDPYAAQLLASTGSDWTKLEEDPQATQATTDKYVSVNRAGIVYRYFSEEMFDDGTIGNSPDAPPNRHQFSTDLNNWQTIPVPDD